jgi:hypothetical protein
MVLTVLEALLKTLVDLFLAFLLTALLEVFEALGHLLADLLGGLQVRHEFLLVLSVFGVQELLQSANEKLRILMGLPIPALLEVGLLPALEVGNAAADDCALDEVL